MELRHDYGRAVCFLCARELRRKAGGISLSTTTREGHRARYSNPDFATVQSRRYRRAMFRCVYSLPLLALLIVPRRRTIDDLNERSGLIGFLCVIMPG